jgi:hypothetical protein
MSKLDAALDTFREAADALAAVRKKYPDMSIEITIEAHGPRIHATLGSLGIDQSVSWGDLSHEEVNVLAISVGDVARQLIASTKPV